MRNILMVLVMVFVGGSAFADFLAFDLESEAPGTVYVAQGFDSNDNAVIVFEGQYPNACYKVGLTEYRIDNEDKKIFIDSKAYVSQEELCARIIVPYTKELHFGTLPAGEYEILFKDGAEYVSKGSLGVEEAKTESIDNFFYAPVQQVVKLKSQNKIKLEGELTNDCLKIAKTEVYHSLNPNVIVVLPIMEMAKKQNCSDKVQSFSYEVELSDIPKGRYLIHTRTLNGRAKNNIVNL